MSGLSPDEQTLVFTFVPEQTSDTVVISFVQAEESYISDLAIKACLEGEEGRFECSVVVYQYVIL